MSASSASTPGGGAGAPRGAMRRTGDVAAERASLLSAASLPRRSKTTRSGKRSAGGSASRGSSSGSSASAVPLPTATASNSARQSCTSLRLSGEEIQRLSPALVAMRPSRLAASLSSTNGRLRTTWVRNAAFCRRARASCRPPASSTSIPGGLQPLQAAAVDLGVGVADRAHDARDAGLDQRVGAGRLAAVVAARLERDVGRRAPRRLAAGGERVALGVRLAAALVPPLAQHAAVARDDAADDGIRARAAAAALGQVERAIEQLRVALVHAPARAASAFQASPGDGWS